MTSRTKLRLFATAFFLLMLIPATLIAAQDTATEEATAEATEEATMEATEEVTPTEEATMEATEEPTAEATEAATDDEEPADDDAPSVDSDGNYTIVRGDTLFSIANRFDVTVDELAAENNIVNPSLIFWGQTLTIPNADDDSDEDDAGTGGPTATEEPTSEPTAAPTETPTDDEDTSDDAETTTYVVQTGDNLYRISLRFNTSFQALADLNGIDDPNVIFIGQELVVPAQ
ncbi:MAG: LysM peptidoglycan-binding domain-containing protein [Chloroflexota bacterium]